MLGLREPPRSIELAAIKVQQPIGDFYIAKIDSGVLFEIAQFDVRRLSQKEGIDAFLGIQRRVSPGRIKEIKQYITDRDATFPTSVVIAVDERCAEFFDENSLGVGKIKLSNFIDEDNDENDILFRDVARIIDGQHRIKAFEDGSISPFELNISIFVGADIATQAEIFSTVNLAQTKVNRSLVYDLFSLAKARSPEKSSHEITVLLDSDETSPFFKRVKRLGVATDGRFGETLSQATVVRGILMHITRDAYTDRINGKKEYKWSYRDGDDKRFIFRKPFCEGRDRIIYMNIFNYFSAVRAVWPQAWNSTERGNILPRTNGYMALMRYLKNAYLEVSTHSEIGSIESYMQILSRSNLSDRDFVSSKFLPGTSGETSLYKALLG